MREEKERMERVDGAGLPAGGSDEGRETPELSLFTSLRWCGRTPRETSPRLLCACGAVVRMEAAATRVESEVEGRGREGPPFSRSLFFFPPLFSMAAPSVTALRRWLVFVALLRLLSGESVKMGWLGRPLPRAKRASSVARRRIGASASARRPGLEPQIKWVGGGAK